MDVLVFSPFSCLYISRGVVLLDMIRPSTPRPHFFSRLKKISGKKLYFV